MEQVHDFFLQLGIADLHGIIILQKEAHAGKTAAVIIDRDEVISVKEQQAVEAGQSGKDAFQEIYKAVEAFFFQ